MKKLLLSLFVAVGLICTSSSATLTYQETGTISGSLRGTYFTNAPVVFTTIADSSNVVYTPGSYPKWTIYGVTTFEIQGFQKGTLTGGNFGFMNADVSAYYAGTSQIGVTDQLGRFLLANSSSATSYNLASEASFSGGALNDNGLWSSDLGNLVIGGATGNASFSAIPEPSTYALFGIGAIGMLMVMRRKKTASRIFRLTL